MFRSLLRFISGFAMLYEGYTKAVGRPITFYYCLHCQCNHYFIHYERDKRNPMLCVEGGIVEECVHTMTMH